MEHLSALDAGFLEVEDADPHISMAIGGIAVLTGPAPDFDALIDLIADRITAEPRLRQVEDDIRTDRRAYLKADQAQTRTTEQQC